MQTPCGKCTSCPCSGSKKKQEQPQPQAQQQPRQKSPNVECLCASRRQQTPAPLQTPMADTYTCSRVREEPVRQVPMEERCTCRIKPTPAQCECDPPVQQQASSREVAPPQTNVQVACGRIPRYNERPTYTPRNNAQCGHCQGGQQRKKKCVIQ